jgi:UDP:flavonoid glycosyltransferase YjiC (YdhE family)
MEVARFLDLAASLARRVYGSFRRFVRRRFHQLRAGPEIQLEPSNYLFIAINGAGLGHLTRVLAVARKLEEVDPAARIIFFTTSVAVPIVRQYGYLCYHLPPADDFKRSGLTATDWNDLYAMQLRKIIELHRQGTVVFDGSYPYAGLRDVMSLHKKVKWVWIRRGNNRQTATVRMLDLMTRAFDLTLVPGEVGAPPVPATTSGPRSIPPVVLGGVDDVLSRNRAMAEIHLDVARPAVYVQLGAGNINAIGSLQDAVVEALRSINGLQVVIGRSPIAMNATSVVGADHTLVDYPNSRYFAAFDLAVLAAGYNSICEAYAFGLPAILIPNMETGSDDQAARAHALSQMDSRRWKTLDVWSRETFTEMARELIMPARVDPGSLGVLRPPEMPSGAQKAAEMIRMLASG